MFAISSSPTAHWDAGGRVTLAKVFTASDFNNLRVAPTPIMALRGSLKKRNSPQIVPQSFSTFQASSIGGRIGHHRSTTHSLSRFEEEQCTIVRRTALNRYYTERRLPDRRKPPTIQSLNSMLRRCSLSALAISQQLSRLRRNSTIRARLVRARFPEA